MLDEASGAEFRCLADPGPCIEQAIGAGKLMNAGVLPNDAVLGRTEERRFRGKQEKSDVY